MKLVPLRKADKGKDNSYDVLMQVTKFSPHKAISVDDMRQRVKILGKLEPAKEAEAIELEDAEHKALVEAVNSYPWPLSSADLLQIIDDVLEAKAPPAPAKND